MKHHIKLLFLGMVAVLLSCNSVNRVLKDPVKYKQVTDHFVEGHGCAADTVTKIFTKDSLIYSTIVHSDTVQTNCPDFTKTLANGTIVKSINGVLTVQTPVKTVEKQTTKTIIRNIRDVALETLYKSQRDVATAQYTVEVKANKKLEDDITVLKKKVIIANLKFYGLITVGALILIISFYSKIKSFIPFLP
jgi:hypothetical protein